MLVSVAGRASTLGHLCGEETGAFQGSENLINKTNINSKRQSAWATHPEMPLEELKKRRDKRKGDLAVDTPPNGESETNVDVCPVQLGDWDLDCE